jgi:16S rRNA (uracil1498-N3)-methyltransferase
VNLYIHQLQFNNCGDRCKPSKRENRKNGNQEGSQKGTREEGSSQEGTREEGRKEEVIAANQQQGNTQRGTLQSVPLSVYAASTHAKKDYTCRRGKRGREAVPLNAMTRRRWIAEHWDEVTAAIVGLQAEHMTRVLRAQPGMEADVVAGGRVFHAEVAAVHPTEVRFNLIAEVQADPALPVTLVLSVYKFDRMEWAIEKATELGVAALAPVLARRTEKHLANAAEKRIARWRRIVHEASQQSRRSDVPLIHDLAPLNSRVRAASGSTRIVLAEQERSTTLRNAIEEAVAAAGQEMPTLEIAIGPEVGWAPEEEALFDANGWRATSLGPRILRAETAAIAALAVVASCLE